MSKCISKDEMGVTVRELKKVLATYEYTWNGMRGDLGYDVEEVQKYGNYVVVLKELVAEYEDMYNELMNE